MFGDELLYNSNMGGLYVCCSVAQPLHVSTENEPRVFISNKLQGRRLAMKKLFAGAALLAIIGFTGSYQAFAGWGQGRMMGGLPVDCPQNRGQLTAPMDAETQAKFDKFFEETFDLRKQIVVKRAEKNALMGSEHPDPAAVGKIAGELFDLRNTLHGKAKAANLQGFGGMGRCCGGCDGSGCYGCGGMWGGQGK